MNIKSILVTGIALAGLAGAGCQTHEGAYAPVNTNRYNLENSSKFVLLDEGAQQSVTLAGPILESFLPDGRMRVVANIRNREDRQIQVQVSCVFKDLQGFPIEGDSSFRNIILTENATEGVEFLSFNDSAKSYTIRVRQAR